MSWAHGLIKERAPPAPGPCGSGVRSLRLRRPTCVARPPSPVSPHCGLSSGRQPLPPSQRTLWAPASESSSFRRPAHSAPAPWSRLAALTQQPSSRDRRRRRPPMSKSLSLRSATRLACPSAPLPVLANVRPKGSSGRTPQIARPFSAVTTSATTGAPSAAAAVVLTGMSANAASTATTTFPREFPTVCHNTVGRSGLQEPALTQFLASPPLSFQDPGRTCRALQRRRASLSVVASFGRVVAVSDCERLNASDDNLVTLDRAWSLPLQKRYQSVNVSWTALSRASC